jgi:hypothetical protein
MRVFLIHPHTFLLAFGAAFAYITVRTTQPHTTAHNAHAPPHTRTTAHAHHRTRAHAHHRKWARLDRGVLTTTVSWRPMRGWQSRLIVQRMCHEPIRPFYTILVPLTFGALNSLVPYLTSHIMYALPSHAHARPDTHGTRHAHATYMTHELVGFRGCSKPWVEEERMVAIFFVYAVGSFLFLCYSLTQQLCRYLKIRAFAIPYPTAASGARHAARPPAAATASRHTSL